METLIGIGMIAAFILFGLVRKQKEESNKHSL